MASQETEISSLSQDLKLLYSRQLNQKTLKEDELLKILKMKTLLVGAGPNCSEVIKNLTRNGSNHIYLYDDSLIEEKDIKNNYFLSENDVGKQKSLCMKQKIPQVTIIEQSQLELECLQDINLNSIVVTQIIDWNLILRLNLISNQLQIPFIFSLQMGLSFFIFSDFGENSNNQHKSLTRYFSEEISEEQMEKITSYNPDQIIEQFILLNSTLNFVKTNQRLPFLYDEDDSNSLLSLYQDLTETKGLDLNLKENIVKRFASTSMIEIPIISEVCGALTSTEIIKSVVTRLQPLNQVLFWENFSLLSQIKNLSIGNLKNSNSSQPLFDYKVLFGEELMTNIENLKILLVGCGAVGCEQVKNLYQMGACRGEKGHLYLVDDDLIEKSNLPRQVLFTESDIKQSKAQTCMKWILSKDSNVKVTAYTKLICEENEDVFNTDFFESLDVIIVAVDSVEARHYLADKAILHKKFLIESGTEGFGAQSSLQVPYFSQKIRIAPKQKVSTQSCYSKSTIKNEGDALIYSKTLFTYEISNLKENSDNFLKKEELIKFYLAYCQNTNVNVIDQQFKDYLQKAFTDLFYHDIIQIGDKYSPIQFDSNDHDHLELIDSIFSILKNSFISAKSTLKVNRQDHLSIKSEHVDLNAILPIFDKDNFLQGSLVYQIAKIRAKCFNIQLTLDRNDAVAKIGDIIPAIIQSTSVASGFALLELFTWMNNKEELEKLLIKVQLLNKTSKENLLARNKIDQLDTNASLDKQVYLNNEEIEEIQEEFENFGFMEYFGNISDPEQIGRYFSSFELKELNNYTLKINKETIFSEIVLQIDEILKTNNYQTAYIIELSNKQVYRRDAETSVYTQLISKQKLLSYLKMNFIDIAKQELNRNINESTFNLIIFGSILNKKKKLTKGNQIGQIKLIII